MNESLSLDYVSWNYNCVLSTGAYKKSEIESFFTLENTWTDHAPHHLLQEWRFVSFMKDILLFEHLFSNKIYTTPTQMKIDLRHFSHLILCNTKRCYQIIYFDMAFIIKIFEKQKKYSTYFYHQIYVLGDFYMKYKLCRVLHENIDILYILSA